MFTFEEVSMSSLILHKVGNKQLGDGYQASKDLIELDDELHSLLCDYFLNHFKSEDIYHFIHHAGIAMNDVYQYCKSIFDNPDTFKEVSVHLLQHLYEKSDHPKIKSGELNTGWHTNINKPNIPGINTALDSKIFTHGQNLHQRVTGAQNASNRRR